MDQPDLKQAIVITSINSPSPAVRLLAQFSGYQLIVVGDRKTPQDWHCPGVIFISVQRQEEGLIPFAKELPWNHYCRKMIGYLYAKDAGAQLIFDTDDDNLPYPNWDIPDFCNKYAVLPEDSGFVNIYSYFTEQAIWPRGFPLNRLKTQPPERKGLEIKQVSVGVWQGLADHDPDVDAIYRLTQGVGCNFNQNPPLVLAPGTICPFNSQNTVFCQTLFPLMYLPVTVTFRFTDILRGLIAQPIMWCKNLLLGFLAPTVWQERNHHDYLQDFISEIPCYLYTEKITDLVIGTVRSEATLGSNLYNVYDTLVTKGLLFQQEMPVLERWLSLF